MEKSLFRSVLLALTVILATQHAEPQDRRILIVSPRVGPEIDSVERKTYNLFEAVRDFQSASFYQSEDGLFWAWTLLKSADGNLRDSVYEVSYSTLEQCAEWIGHHEEILAGTYALGSLPAKILYANGTKLTPPPAVSSKVLNVPQQVFHDYLPLANNVNGLTRPRFSTIHLVLSLGASKGNFSGIERLTGPISDAIVPLIINMEVPFGKESPLSFFSGFGFSMGGAGGGTLTQSSAFLLFRFRSYSFFNPILGFGATENHYSAEVDSGGSHIIDITASLVSPTFLVGIELVPDFLDLLLAVPLVTSLSTTFEGRSYTVEPVGFQLSLLVLLQ